MDTVALSVLLGAPLLLYVLWRFWRTCKHTSNAPGRLPPVQSGWLPWIGCAVDFGREPLYYIDRTRKKASTQYAHTLYGRYTTSNLTLLSLERPRVNQPRMLSNFGCDLCITCCTYATKVNCLLWRAQLAHWVRGYLSASAEGHSISLGCIPSFARLCLNILVYSWLLCRLLLWSITTTRVVAVF